MGIKLKSGVDIEELRKFGFKPGSEWAIAGERCLNESGYKYMHEWWHKFLMNPDEPEKIYYADNNFDQPMVQIIFRIGNGDDLYIDCIPSCTYHIGGEELDIISETIYNLTLAGVIEKY